MALKKMPCPSTPLSAGRLLSPCNGAGESPLNMQLSPLEIYPSKQKNMLYWKYAGFFSTRRIALEQIPHVGTEEFTEQFTSVLYEHWSEIIQVLNQQSPRIAALLRVSSPSGMKRINGGWQIQVTTRKMAQPERLRQPRDNEIVAHAIRSWARSTAQLNLPYVIVSFVA